MSATTENTTTARQREQQLNRMPKADLARLHIRQGGCMGLATYLKWRKDELVSVILEIEGLDPWA